MAAIKSYSYLQQSKKLAEFLPIESADMKWFFWKEEIDAPKPPTFGYSKTAAESYKDTEAVFLPCWSLTSLLGVLPYCPDLSKHTDGKWYITTYPNDVYTCLMAYDNPVDACVAMIELLHELKML